MKILILGAGGFIGSNLVEHLLATTKHELVGIDADDAKLLDMKDADGRFAFYKQDVQEAAEAVDSLVAAADVAVDLIAHANPSTYVKSPLDVVELNLFDNLKVLEGCKRHRTRLMQFSSCEVYGITDGQRVPFREDTSNLVMGPVQNQRWIYACAKQLLERMIFAEGQERRLEYTIVRPFNFVGPKIDYMVEAGTKGGPRVFSHFMSALVTGGPLYLVNGGDAHRSYTYIGDAVDAIRRVIENPDRCRNEIINIGTPDNGITIRELAFLMIDLYKELTGKSPRSEIVEITGEEFYGQGYEDCDWRVPDTTKIRALGWNPRYDLRATFRRTMEWHLERLPSFDNNILNTAGTT